MQNNEPGPHPMNLDPYLMSLTKVNAKWIKDLNIRPYYTMKLLEENTGKKLIDNGFGNNFLDLMLKAQKYKSKNQQIGLH